MFIAADGAQMQRCIQNPVKHLTSIINRTTTYLNGRKSYGKQMSREAQNTASMAIKIKDNEIQNSKTEKLLCMTIDDKFNFNNHLQKMLKKLIIKVNVLPKITPYMCILKRKLIMNSFFISQLNCCPLVWMSHSSLMNNRVN